MADSKKKKYANPEAVTEAIKAIRRILGNVSSAGIEEGGELITGGGQSIVSALFALDEAVSGKADKSTSLAGYGITDKLFKSLGTNAACEDTAGWGVFKIVVNGYAPYTYGTILQWEATDNYDKKPSEGGWYVQLFAATENKGLYMRTRTNGNAWRNWVQLATTDNIPTKTSQLTNDSKFVEYRDNDSIGMAHIVDINSGLVLALAGCDDSSREYADLVLADENYVDKAVTGKADKVAVEIHDMEGATLCNLGVIGWDKVYKVQNGMLNSLSISGFELDSEYNNNEHHEVLIEFDCAINDMTLSLPSNVSWANDEPPTFKAWYHYQLSITRWVEMEGVNTYYQAVCVGFMM